MIHQAGLKNSSLSLPLLDLHSDRVSDRTITQVRCPNCGSLAERHHLVVEQLTRTQCPVCDYLMVTCTVTARVIEAYAPGRYLHR
ncbi:MAG: replication restart DNA helicase PriA [Leptolyngbyaceae cyanobacterium]